MVASPAWVQRRDPGLVTVRRAVRVAAVACVTFYLCRYVANNPVLATYALFSTVALGFLSQVPGPAVRRATTLLWSLPVACLLVTVATLMAGNLWISTAGMLVFGFLISFAGVGGPRLVGLTAGMQLLFILPGFPPYAPDTLLSRLGGVVVGIGLLALAERWLWPDPAPVNGEHQLAAAADALGELLAVAATGTGIKDSATAGAGGTSALTAAEDAAEAIRPSRLPPEARPASAGRHDRALSHAAGLLRYALARLRELAAEPPPPPAATELLRAASRTAKAAAVALRGGPLLRTVELAQALTAVQRERRESAERVPADALGTALALAVTAADAVWAMATAVRVAGGATVEVGHGTREVRRERFPYAFMGPVGLWWERFAIHLTPRSVYFQQAVRVAVALAVARLVAGVLELSHGFWVLLATLTLLRSRAADTRIALRPALIGTVAGAVVSAVLLILIGGRTTVYAAMLPPVMVVAFAAGALLGPAWGQALFTVVVTFVFSQLAPANVTLAGVRLTDVLLGAVIGVGAGVLAWPRGAGGELRRSSAAFLSSGGALVRDTARVLTAAAPPSTPSGPSAASASSRDGGAEGPAKPVEGRGRAVSVGAVVGAGGTVHRVEEAMALADASFGMYQAERHSPDESVVDWQAVIVAGYNILRGSELLRDTCKPGGLAPWRDVVVGSAARVEEACDRLATAISKGQDPRAGPVDVGAAPDNRVADVQAWLTSIADDLARVACPPTGPHTNPGKS